MTNRAFVAALSLLVLALVLGTRLTGDGEPKLTEAKRAELTIAILTRDNAQLRLDALIRELTVPGYELLGSGEYRKAAPPEVK